MALTDVLGGSNGTNGNGSKETWGGDAAYAESPDGKRRVEVMVTKGAVGVALDHVFGGDRFEREITGVETLAVVGDFAVVDDPERPDSVRVIERLRASDVNFLDSLAELVPVNPGVEPAGPSVVNVAASPQF